MDIKLELLRGYMADYVKHHIEDFEIDANKISDSRAIEILSEIRQVIQEEGNTDFECVEKIVLIFEKYQLSTGGRHDF